MRMNPIGLLKGAFATLLALAAFTLSCNVATPGRPEKVFVSDEGRFEATFPGHPEVATRKVEAGEYSLPWHAYTAETKSPIAKYSVQYFEINEALDGPAEEIFDWMTAPGLEQVG